MLEKIVTQLFIVDVHEKFDVITSGESIRKLIAILCVLI